MDVVVDDDDDRFLLVISCFRLCQSHSKVVPCVGDESLPDGVIVSAKHRLPRTAMKMYEVCAKGGVDFQASLGTFAPNPYSMFFFACACANSGLVWCSVYGNTTQRGCAV